MPYGSLLADVVQSSATGTPPQFNDTTGTQVGTLCRAWVNFNGSSGASPTIKASFNVSSVTRNSTGNYTIVFTNAMSDVNYSWSGSSGNDNVNGTAWVCGPALVALSTWKQTTRINIVTSYQNTLVADIADVSLSVFR